MSESERETELPAESTVAKESVGPQPTEPPKRRLLRSRDDRVLAGVCGGLGEYLGVDTVIIRIVALILLFGRRRKKEEAPMPPEVPPEQVETMPPSRPPERGPTAPPPAPPAARPPGPAWLR